MRHFFTGIGFLAAGIVSAQTRRPLRPDDVYRYQAISDMKLSPEGNWISYTLSKVDSAKDKTVSHVWMTAWDGSGSLQLTNGDEGDAGAQWSPDGKYISFTSSRHEEEGNQLWLLDRRGGEGQKLIEIKASIESVVWRSDGKKILLALKDPDYSDSAKSKTKKPWVMDRLHFKQDYEGYLDRRQTHLYLFDIGSKKIDTLTRGNWSETSPAWNHDGTRIVFISNHSDEPDLTPNSDIWMMDAKPGAPARQLTTWKGDESQPCWSFDDKHIAWLQSSSEGADPMYGHNDLCVMNADGTGIRVLTDKLDRNIQEPRWSQDNVSVAGLVEDDRQQYAALFSIRDGSMKKLAGGNFAIEDLAVRPNNEWAIQMSDPSTPPELYALTGPVPRRITHVQDSFLLPLQLSAVQGFRSRGSDSTDVGCILFLPPGSSEKNLPTLMLIHGGPVGQDEFGFNINGQMLAAAGFAVASVNYRGSSGRGDAFTQAIRADWGNKEITDILGATDHLVHEGIADSARLGMLGWSYGGILTDYMIASTTRFKAASSGAGSALQFSMYGSDEYIAQYTMELGNPWENTDKWIQLSYPFFKAARIKTPTLFMACQFDFNVPVIGAEQMYQALHTLHVPTQLVIYPGQYHGISTPSYKVDRYQRWIGWFGQYLR